MKSVCIIFLSLVIFACASSGTKVDQNYVSQIEKGVTTEADVVARLGQPMGVALSSNGEKILTYMHVSSHATPESFIPIAGIFIGGAKSEATIFTVTINKETGIVKDWNYSQSNNTVKTGLANRD
ncbi:hypothetical protein [Alteromonas sp. RKMC-009]|uniref:hypothetical protein n=1 Tax=Alteromonas sp. RKMC-009 TaxID=2267264 RepID=UPI000E68E26C|nr:hypothetical protein [Alteromonas sp. RKMC-009]AYA63861.1 hypothetical protein DS731_07505 [Alteromonas sp. RKMC-009]